MTKKIETATIEEFDAWNDEAEAEALAAAAQKVSVRHIIKNNEYWALAPSGHIYKLPLFLSIENFDALSNAASDTESVEQIKRILAVFAGDEQAKQLEREPMQVAFNLLQDYGLMLSKSQGVELGKSPVSADSSTPKTE